MFRIQMNVGFMNRRKQGLEKIREALPRLDAAE
jgi:hypothetical protein